MKESAGLVAAALLSIRLSTWPVGALVKVTERARPLVIQTEATRPMPS
jgi:hypothetical protein